jgi:hypothetical protein
LLNAGYAVSQTSILGISMSYGPDFSYGDLVKRYGNHLSFGLGTEYFTQNNYGFSLEWRYMFGDNVKTDPYNHLRQVGGNIVGVDGLPSDHYYTIVGDQLHLQVRKLIGSKPHGWVIGGSVGFIAYKTVIKDLNRTIAQAFEPYSFYYDQLARGISVKQLFGYEFHSQSGLINGSITIENSLSFSKYIRNNFDNNTNLNDHSLGIRGRWIIPLYKGQKKEEVKYF